MGKKKTAQQGRFCTTREKEAEKKESKREGIRKKTESPEETEGTGSGSKSCQNH